MDRKKFIRYLSGGICIACLTVHTGTVMKLEALAKTVTSDADKDQMTGRQFYEQPDGKRVTSDSDRSELQGKFYYEAPDNSVKNDIWQQIEQTQAEQTKQGWVKEDQAWRYYENGAYITGAKHIEGEIYYFNPNNGNMTQSDFYELENGTFYFDDKGHRVTGWQEISQNGSKQWYWFDNVGIMMKGWRDIDAVRYYFKSDGAMAANEFLTIEGYKFHFAADGHVELGWQLYSEEGRSSWYYFRNGDDHRNAALEGWVNGIEGDSHKYFFWTDGYATKEGYARPTGALALGDPYEGIYQNGVLKYIADKDGHLMTNCEIDVDGGQYRCDGDGNVQSLQPELNDAATYIRQNDNVKCTVASAAMMIKRKALLDNNTNWGKVTLDKAVSNLWTSGGLVWNGTYNFDGVRYSITSDDSSIKNSNYGNQKAGEVRYQHIQNMLAQHPEGVVAYFYDSGNQNKQHAVLVTAIKDGVIYCLDPASGKNEAVPLASVGTYNGSFGLSDQGAILRLDNTSDGRMFLWYIR